MRAGAMRAEARGGRSAAPEAASGWRRFARSNKIIRRRERSLFTWRTALKTAVVAGLALVFAFAAWGAARWLTRVSWLPVAEVRIEGLRHVGKAEALDPRDPSVRLQLAANSLMERRLAEKKRRGEVKRARRPGGGE